MKFEISKAYSALRAEEVPVPCCGYVAHNPAALKERVEVEESLEEITAVLSDKQSARFLTAGSDEMSFVLAYPVCLPSNKEWYAAWRAGTALEYIVSGIEEMRWMKVEEGHNWLQDGFTYRVANSFPVYVVKWDGHEQGFMDPHKAERYAEELHEHGYQDALIIVMEIVK